MWWVQGQAQCDPEKVTGKSPRNKNNAYTHLTEESPIAQKVLCGLRSSACAVDFAALGCHHLHLLREQVGLEGGSSH